MLELLDVVKHYETPGEVVHAVDGVTLRVPRGEVAIVHGPSGAGKTTMLLLAAGILRPDAGAVRFDGRDLAGMSESEASDYRLRTLGFVFQQPALMPMTAVENAALPLLGAGESVSRALRRVQPLIERVGLGSRAHHLPSQLSGGERQRVALARALAAEPKLILADEPTGSLDSRRGAEVAQLLHELAREQRTGILVVTHDLRMRRHADRVYTLEDGKLTETDLEPATGTTVADAAG